MVVVWGFEKAAREMSDVMSTESIVYIPCCLILARVVSFECLLNIFYEALAELLSSSTFYLVGSVSDGNLFGSSND